MPTDLLCRVRLATGEPCGYVPQGATTKERLTDLFRHQDAHLQHITTDAKGQVTVQQ